MKILIFLFSFFSLVFLKTKTKKLEFGDHVNELNSENFFSELEKHDFNFIKFYAPWCGHCKALAPKFSEAAEKFSKIDQNVAFHHVNCQNSSDLCKKFDIAGFPSVKLFKKSKFYRQYDDERKVESIMAWLKFKTAEKIQKLTKLDQLTNTRSELKRSPIIIGVYPSPMHTGVNDFTELAEMFENVIFFTFIIGEISNSDDVAEILDFLSLPTDFNEEAVLIHRPKGFFLDQKSIYKLEKISSKFVMKKEIINYGYPLIEEINSHTFDRFSSSEKYIVALFCDYNNKAEKKALLKALAKAAAKDNIFHYFAFGYSDSAFFGSQYEAMGGNKNDLPGVSVMHIEKSQNFVMDPKLELTAENIYQFCKGIMQRTVKPKYKSQPIPTKQNSVVYELVADSFEKIVYDDQKDVLVLFHAPWCGHCKKLMPKYKKLAKILRPINDKILVTRIDGSENDIPDEYLNIKGFPTIVFYPANGKEHPAVYKGKRTLTELKKFIYMWSWAGKSDLQKLIKELDDDVWTYDPEEDIEVDKPGSGGEIDQTEVVERFMTEGTGKTTKTVKKKEAAPGPKRRDKPIVDIPDPVPNEKKFERIMKNKAERDRLRKKGIKKVQSLFETKKEGEKKGEKKKEVEKDVSDEL